MKCKKCLSILTPKLNQSAGIKSWYADLEDPRKLIYANLEDSAEAKDLIEIIRQNGFDAELAGDVSSTAEKEDFRKPFQLSTYWPLFLVVTYVAGATVLTQFLQGAWQWYNAMAMFMGFFFLGFAFFKFLNVSKFADSFSTYDVVARRLRLYALAYPWIEATLGLMYVTSTWLSIANSVTAVIMSVGLIGVVSAVIQKKTIQCACLGTAFNLPMSMVTVIENSVMLAMALAMFIPF